MSQTLEPHADATVDVSLRRASRTERRLHDQEA